jgi:hypothetical protein
LNEDLGNALVSCCFITGGNKILGFTLEDVKMVEFQQAIKNGYPNLWQGRKSKMNLWRIWLISAARAQGFTPENIPKFFGISES